MFWPNQIVTRCQFYNISVGQQVQIPTTGSFSQFFAGVKNKQKYARCFGPYLPMNVKKRAPVQPRSRFLARFARILCVFRLFLPKMAGKNLSCLGRQKRLLSWKRAYKRTEIKVRKYKRNVLSSRQTGIYSIAYPSEVKTFNAFSKFSSFTRM